MSKMDRYYYGTYNQKLNFNNFYYNKRLTSRGSEIIDKFNKLENLLIKFDGIKGKTALGRDFKLDYEKEKIKFSLEIYDGDDNVYLPYISVSDIYSKNILSIVNKLEDNYFNKPAVSKSKYKRSKIEITGDIDEDEDEFKVSIGIIGNQISSEIYYLDTHNNNMYIGAKIPDHIQSKQMHDYIYLYFLNKYNVTQKIEYYLRNMYSRCCGKPTNSDKFCSNCGKKVEVRNLTITDIKGERLKTLLT